MAVYASTLPRFCPTNMPDGEAVTFYKQNCKCSRTYFPIRRKRGYLACLPWD
jgi:hypothetical protein